MVTSNKTCDYKLYKLGLYETYCFKFMNYHTTDFTVKVDLQLEICQATVELETIW